VNEAALLPIRFFRLFLESLNAELGPDTLGLVLAKGDLPPDLLDPHSASRFNSASAAETYARIQRALRVYYGRGARGTLVRIGRVLWGGLLEQATFTEKVQAGIARGLPPPLRPKPALELLAHFLSETAQGASVHTLDMDLMLADHAAAAAAGQHEDAPICSVTLGLVQEALFWANGHEYDVLETSCRAAGGDACEFTVTLSGKT
jgi:predicted hydrocarbon binding protein